MGKAKWPNDTKRPTPKGILKAIEKHDMEALAQRLTVRQRAFCHEYVVDFNGTAAAIRAGYAPKNADRQAWLLLRMHKGVQVYIDHLMLSKEAKITAINPDYVISRVTEIINKSQAKDADKLRGLELLARHLGMFIDKTEISGPEGGPIQTEEVKREANEFLQNLQQLVERNEEKKIDVELVDA